MATTSAKMANGKNGTKTKPVHEVRLGRIKAAIWANETENGLWFNVTFSRIYKDGNNWKTSDSFGRDDLPLLAKVADTAHTWIFMQHQGSQEPPMPESTPQSKGDIPF